MAGEASSSPVPILGEERAASQLCLVSWVLGQCRRTEKLSGFVTVGRLPCSSLQGDGLWPPSSILLVLTLISGHLVTSLNPEPRKDDLGEGSSQWREQLYHPELGSGRRLLCSTGGQDVSSETKGKLVNTMLCG